MSKLPQLPELREPTLKATYRGYYSPGAGRLMVVFFGCWIGTSFENAEKAHANLSHCREVEGGDIIHIDTGTHEAWS